MSIVKAVWQRHIVPSTWLVFMCYSILCKSVDRHYLSKFFVFFCIVHLEQIGFGGDLPSLSKNSWEIFELGNLLEFSLLSPQPSLLPPPLYFLSILTFRYPIWILIESILAALKDAFLFPYIKDLQTVLHSVPSPKT